MNAPDTPTRYAVVALFDPLPLGATIDRAQWPAHVTLVSNFRAVASAEAVAEAVRAADPLREPLAVELGALAFFGPGGDVLVRLVHSAPAERAHARLAERIERLPGFAEEEPAYWRAGYRPHLTLGPHISAAEGERRIAARIAVAEILGGEAQVVALLEAPETSVI
jgi:hypothetical protein